MQALLPLVAASPQWCRANAVHRLTGMVRPCLRHKPEVAFAKAVGLEASKHHSGGAESGRNLSLGSTPPWVACIVGTPCFRRSSPCEFSIAIISSHFWPPQRGKLCLALRGGGGGEGLTPVSPRLCLLKCLVCKGLIEYP